LKIAQASSGKVEGTSDPRDQGVLKRGYNIGAPKSENDGGNPDWMSSLELRDAD
jgi:hypothetical protein